MHTEGSILFADPNLFDQKSDRKEGWRWGLANKLLDSNQSEACTSNLLSLVEEFRLESDNGKHYIDFDFLELLELFLENPKKFWKFSTELAESYEGFSLNNINAQLNSKLKIISAIESYLMANWQEDEEELPDIVLHQLVSNTLAYYLASPDQKKSLLKLFNILADNIHKHAPDQEHKKVYARTLQGLFDSISIEGWVKEHIGELSECKTHQKLLECVWPLIRKYSTNKAFRNCTSEDVLKKIAKGWITGEPYTELFKHFKEDTKIGRYKPKLDHIVDICEDGFAYDGMLIIAGVIEVSSQLTPGKDWIDRLRILQKKLKYGLHTEEAIRLYEMGFADRIIATEMSNLLDFSKLNRREIKAKIKANKRGLKELLDSYPQYFSVRLNTL